MLAGVAGADPELPGASPTADDGPRHQILGDWRLGRRGEVSFRARGARVSGRAASTFAFDGCRVPRGTLIFRGYRFQAREDTADVWSGRVLRPTRSCRARYAESRVKVLSDLRMVETSADRRLRRIRPRPRASDPVLGTWERERAQIEIRRTHRGYYEAVPREDILISNGCRIAAGTVIWRLRPSAPERYDGFTKTFEPPPGCDEGTPAGTRWRLDAEAGKLFREAADGSLVEYVRAG